MQSLITVGGEFWIDNNDQLTDLSPLSSLTAVGLSLYVVNNGLLSSLKGLESIDPNSISSLNIYNNPFLSECDVQSICDYLNIPNVMTNIGNNAPGCNNASEVQEACESCLPDGITFTTQEQIDNFQINYPGCTEIEGNVEFDVSWTGDTITNLNGLNVLQSIGGNLTISTSYLVDLMGLNIITSIGGNLLIEWNNFLTSVTGLNSLDTIGGNLEINGNTSLINLTGLDNLTVIGGNLNIGYYAEVPPLGANPVLNSLDGLNSLTEIGGDLSIEKNDSLLNITGLNNLYSIAGNLSIKLNDNLASLTGLDNVDSSSIEELVIWGNNSLSDCSVQGICNYLSSPNGTVDIGYNAPGCNSIIEIADSCWLPYLPCLPNGNYYFHFQSVVDSFQVNFPNCTQLYGDVFIWGNDIVDLTGLSVITSIWGRLFIGNTIVTDLEGLDNLNETAGLYISENSELTDLLNLENLITNWGNIYLIDNPKLISLSGIDNLESEMISQVIIYGNDTLSKCDVQSICNYIAMPNGELEIHNNAPGCNSPEEVDLHCQTFIEEIKTRNGISIIPNPSKDKITISSSTIIGITQLTIFNVNGEKVIERHLTIKETQIDISTLPRGVYFVRLQNEKMVEVGKVIKE